MLAFRWDLGSSGIAVHLQTTGDSSLGENGWLVGWTLALKPLSFLGSTVKSPRVSQSIASNPITTSGWWNTPSLCALKWSLKCWYAVTKDSSGIAWVGRQWPAPWGECYPSQDRLTPQSVSSFVMDHQYPVLSELSINLLIFIYPIIFSMHLLRTSTDLVNTGEIELDVIPILMVVYSKSPSNLNQYLAFVYFKIFPYHISP